METVKYPKTMHLPFSKGLQNDDRRLEDEHCFDGKTVAVTVKMDGENTSMYRGVGKIHARSLYAMTHPSQTYINSIHGTIQHKIPEGWRVCGENMYARHSIPYHNLESFYHIFSVWNEKNETLNYNDELKWIPKLNEDLEDFPELKVQPVEFLAFVKIENGDFSLLERFYNQVVAEGEEGIVIRNVESFHYDDFQRNVAKAVRKNHVQTDVHWTKTWIPNKLREG